MVIGMLEATVSIIAAVYWFDVPLRGGLLELYTGLLLFTAAVTGIGLMISSISATQQQALLGAFLFMVPSIILSGFATPIANMPPLVQDLTWIKPHALRPGRDPPLLSRTTQLRLAAHRLRRHGRPCCAQPHRCRLAVPQAFGIERGRGDRRNPI